jgi:hypothetical protein
VFFLIFFPFLSRSFALFALIAIAAAQPRNKNAISSGRDLTSTSTSDSERVNGDPVLCATSGVSNAFQAACIDSFGTICITGDNKVDFGGVTPAVVGGAAAFCGAGPANNVDNTGRAEVVITVPYAYTRKDDKFNEGKSLRHKTTKNDTKRQRVSFDFGGGWAMLCREPICRE